MTPTQSLGWCMVASLCLTALAYWAAGLLP